MRPGTPNHDNMDLMSNEENIGELTITSSHGNLHHTRSVEDHKTKNVYGSDTPNFEEKQNQMMQMQHNDYIL